MTWIPKDLLPVGVVDANLLFACQEPFGRTGLWKQITVAQLKDLLGGGGGSFDIAGLGSIATPLVAADLLAVSVGGTNKKATAQDIADFVGVNLTGLTVTAGTTDLAFFDTGAIKAYVDLASNPEHGVAGCNFQVNLSGEDTHVYPFAFVVSDNGYTGGDSNGAYFASGLNGVAQADKILFFDSGIYALTAEVFAGTSPSVGSSAAIIGFNDGNHTFNYGVVGSVVLNVADNIKGVAVAGSVQFDQSFTGNIKVGAYFEVQKHSSAPTFESSVLLLDNRDSGVPLLKARVNGNLFSWIDEHGTFYQGKNTPSIWGGNSVAAFEAYYDQSVGEPNACSSVIGVTEMTDLSQAYGHVTPYVLIDGGVSLAQVSLETQQHDGSTYFLTQINSGFEGSANHNSFRIDSEYDWRANSLMLLWPTVADEGSAIAYLFDTANALSNAAAKLLSVKNHGTEKFAIGSDGLINIAQAPTAETVTPDHTILMQANGVSYKIPCVAA